LVVPVTLAAKACVASRNTVTVLGVTATLMLGEGVAVGTEECVGAEPPPQPQKPITAAIARAIALGWNLTFGSKLVRPILRGDCMISSSALSYREVVQVRRDWRKVDWIAMMGVWPVSVFHLIVQLSEFRGLVQERALRMRLTAAAFY
jgi:hypothetical protein